MGGQLEKHHLETEFEGARPQVSAEAFVFDGAALVGDVSVGEGSSIWFGAVLRGDIAPVVVGRFTSIQDNAVIHVARGGPALIGDYVTVGHSAIVHAATVEDDCLIGMHSTILDGAVIGRGSIVGAGAVVTEGTHVPPGSLVVGVPAKVIRSVTAEQIEGLHQHAIRYTQLAKRHQG